MILFDIPPDSGIGAIGAGAVAIAVVFFLVFATVAFIAFKMLKRSVKMAIRLVVVGIILVVAVIGSAALFWFGSGSSKPSRPGPPYKQTR